MAGRVDAVGAMKNEWSRNGFDSFTIWWHRRKYWCAERNQTPNFDCVCVRIRAYIFHRIRANVCLKFDRSTEYRCHKYCLFVLLYHWPSSDLRVLIVRSSDCRFFFHMRITKTDENNAHPTFNDLFAYLKLCVTILLRRFLFASPSSSRM